MTIGRALPLSKWNRRALIFHRRVRRATQRIEPVLLYILRGDKSLDFVMVSWRHNTATDIKGINRKYNHREHRGAQRIDLKTLCSLYPLWLNPVAFTDCVGSIRTRHKSLDFQTLPDSG